MTSLNIFKPVACYVCSRLNNVGIKAHIFSYSRFNDSCYLRYGDNNVIRFSDHNTGQPPKFQVRSDIKKSIKDKGIYYVKDVDGMILRIIKTEGHCQSLNWSETGRGLPPS